MTHAPRDRSKSAAGALAEHAFPDHETVAGFLAEAVAAHLRAGIAARGAASLVVSGGSTPRRFMELLSQRPLDWRHVLVTLADERWVPPDSARSNERLVRDALMRGPASVATFEPLYIDAGDVDESRRLVAPRIATIARPFDVVVLGMGDDGHTASLFPNGDRVHEALDPHGAETVFAMHAPAAAEARLTLSLPALVDTRALFLHIEGEAKRATLARALREDAADADYPIRAVIRHARAAVELFWCP